MQNASIIDRNELKLARKCVLALETLISHTHDPERRKQYNSILELIRQDLAKAEGLAKGNTNLP